MTKRLPYRPDQLFALVGDIESYPEFVPWLTSMRVWNLREVAPGVTSIDAEAGVGFSFLRERFATRVVRDANAMHIAASLLHGPFRALQNDWRFEADPAGTRVDFTIDFAFKSRVLDVLLHDNMDRAVDRLIACFETRAARVYGPAFASNSISRAVATLASRIDSRPMSPNRISRWRVARPSRATAKWTKPTGFCALPPPGPAIPVIETAIWAGEAITAPWAMARATGSDTAP